MHFNVFSLDGRHMVCLPVQLLAFGTEKPLSSISVLRETSCMAKGSSKCCPSSSNPSARQEIDVRVFQVDVFVASGDAKVTEGSYGPHVAVGFALDQENWFEFVDVWIRGRTKTYFSSDHLRCLFSRCIDHMESNPMQWAMPGPK